MEKISSTISNPVKYRSSLGKRIFTVILLFALVITIWFLRTLSTVAQFPTTSVIEDFNCADQDPLGTCDQTWSGPIFSGNGQLEIITNNAEGNTNGTNNNSYISSGTFGPDSEAYYTVAAKPGENVNIWIFLRITSPGGAVDGYACNFRTEAGTDLWRLIRYDDGNGTIIDSGNAELAAGDGFGCEMIGGTLRALHRVSGTWSEIVSFDDATYSAAGYIGAGIQDQFTAEIDDFAGGTVVAGGAGSGRPPVKVRGGVKIKGGVEFK